MDDKVKKRLLDVMAYINEVEYLCSERPRDFNVFVSDKFFYRAIQMDIAVIGEAMSHILKENPSIAISHARKIVDTRNYIIHGYDSLRPDILWGIVIRHIPILKREIAALLEQ